MVKMTLQLRGGQVTPGTQTNEDGDDVYRLFPKYVLKDFLCLGYSGC